MFLKNARHRSMTVTLLLTLVLGVLNFLTGYEISFSIFYLIPTAYALWQLGKHLALATAFISATVWFISDMATGHTFSHPMIPVWNAAVRLGFFVVFVFLANRWRTAYQKKQQLIVDLQKALEKIKVLSGLIPICSYCKSMRDDEGYWQQVEAYVQAHSDATFTHSICPDCLEKWKKERGFVDTPEHSKSDSE